MQKVLTRGCRKESLSAKDAYIDILAKHVCREALVMIAACFYRFLRMLTRFGLYNDF